MAKIPSSAKCFPNVVVILTIPALFFTAMILGHLRMLPINVPLSSVAIIGFIFVVFLLFVKHNANYSICKMRYSSRDMEEDLTNELERNSLTLHNEKKSILNLDEFLKEYYSEIRNDNFVAVASSVFPMLGILGTFVAIAISMPNFAVTDTTALDNEISLLLSGVGSAFYASIYGILLSLIWTYFEKSGLSKVDKFTLSIKEKFRHAVWTQSELKVYEYTQFESKDNKFIAALKDTFNLEFVKNLNEQHLSSFKSIMDQSNENFTQIAQHLNVASNELKETLKQMDTNQDALEARNSIERHLQEFTQATNDFEKNSKIYSAQLTISLNKTFEKIDNEIGDIVVKLADFATHVSLQSQEVQNSIQSYHRMVANQVRAK